ncbi:MAG: amino acid adenylation domain-containing protein [Acidimicrobiales bacterium]|jgi:amino acid adenylation domain-containing protein
MGHEPVGFEVSVQQTAALDRNPGIPPARTQVCVRFGALPAPDRLADAVARSVEHHEILRTTFVRPAGAAAPLQVVNPSMDVPIVELRAPIDDPSLRNELDAAWREELSAATGPVVRVRVVRQGEGGALILTALAAVADVRSLTLLAAAIGDGADTRLAEEPLQYADYAAWQGNASTEPEAVAHWDAVAIDRSGAGSLPRSGAPDSGGTGPVRPRVTPLPWSRTLGTAVERIAESFDVEPSDVWLAAWAIVAQRLAGTDHATIAFLDDRRGVEGLEAAVGPYARTLPLTVEGDPEASLQSMVRALGHQRGAAVAAAEACPSSADPGLPFGFQYRTTPDALDSPPDRTDCQLVLSVSGTGSEVTAALWADPNQIDVVHAEHVGHMLSAVLTGLTADPDAAVRRISGLDAAVHVPWLTALDGPAADLPGVRFVHRFEQQVERHPDRPALRYGDEVLTYAELDRRADGLARVLVDSGADRSAPVAVVMQRSTDQVVSVLAVLKAGYAHVCINPDQPATRIAGQLAHSGASILLTVRHTGDSLPPFDGTVLTVDEIDTTGNGRVAVEVDPDDLAYIVYTSGSTGSPKGVAVTHGSLENYVAFVIDELLGAPDLADGWSFALVTSLSTDLGNTSLYPALASGGCLTVVPLDVAMDPELFASHNRANPVDVLKITPSHLEALLAAGGTVLPRKLLISGGEALRWELVDRVTALSDCRVVNHYGPSETTVGSLVFELDSATLAHRARPVVPIGRPLTNTRVRIVDDSSGQVPPGAPGELLIGGSGLARGYWRDDERTAESFPDDPLGDDSGRYYRTGDLARHLPDGTVEFLGRIDGQIKVRGFRVETGEIEVNLRSHPEVQQAVVVQREDTPGDHRLVAYIVSPYSPGPEPASLREFLRDRIPDYMVPAAYVELESMPLLANGKLDRAGLPEPTEDDVDGHREYVAPSTDTEKVVAELFGELLGIEQVGAGDDFFALGGHSLLATQAIARLRGIFRVELEVHLLFTAPTVAALAGEVDSRRVLEDDDDLADLLRQIDELSDEEAEALLAAETEQNPSP